MRTPYGPPRVMGAELGTLSSYLCFSNKPQGRSHGTGATGQEPRDRSHGAGHRPRLHVQTQGQESWALKASLAFSLPEGCSALLLFEVLMSTPGQDSLK